MPIFPTSGLNSQMRFIRNGAPSCKEYYSMGREEQYKVSQTFTRKQQISWDSATSLPSANTVSSYAQKIVSFFNDAASNQHEHETKFTEGYRTGYKAGLWKGRKETLLYCGAFLGFYSFFKTDSKSQS